MPDLPPQFRESGGVGAVVYTVANHKGGAGKTATAANLGAVLGRRGRRVLLVDLDPQVHLSPWFSRPPADQGRSTGWVLMYPDASLAEIIDKDVAPGVDLAPGNRADLTTAASLLAQDPIDGNHRLEKALAPLRDDYDFVLVDTPPTVGALTVNGILAADQVIVTALPAPLYVFGAIEMSHMVAKLAERQGGDGPRVAGVLLVRYDGRPVVARAVEEDLLEQSRHDPSFRLLATRIPQDTKVEEAVYEGAPLVATQPASRAALAYEALADELMALELEEVA